MTINYCPECGSKITKTTIFCGECGTKIYFAEQVPKPVKLHCQSCDYSTIENERFCPECGIELVNDSNLRTNKSKTVRATKKSMDRINTTKSTKSNTLTGVYSFPKKTIAAILLGLIAIYFIPNWHDGSINENKKPQSIRQTTGQNSAPRTINPKLSETKDFTIVGSSNTQEIVYSDNIIINLPSHFTENTKKLEVSIATLDKSMIVEDFDALQLIDIKLESNKQPSKPMAISYHYKLKDLNNNISVDSQLAAYRWSEDIGSWMRLATKIDKKNQKITLITNHLSLFSFVKLKEFAEKIKGLERSELLLNTIYITPEKNFRILFSQKEIEDDAIVNDTAWKGQFTQKGYNYNKKYPRYIQDMGYFLEYSLKQYTEKFHFTNPAGVRKTFLGDFHKSIVVKINSYFVTIKGDPNYEKFNERLHIPINFTNSTSGAQITLAHELFHAIQAEYYSRLGLSTFLSPTRHWWLEATAEYAAYGMVWPSLVGEMKFGLGVNFLSFPINSTGNKSHTSIGWSDSPYEYKASVWIKYLVDNGMNLEKAITHDASDYSPSINSLESFLMKDYRVSLVDLYRSFSNWMIFSSKGILKGYPIASFNKNSARDIAIKQNKYTLGSNSLSYFFNLHGPYSTSLWAIQINQENHAKIKGKLPVFIKLKNKSAGVDANVFVLPKGSRTLTNYSPLKLLTTEGQTFKVMVKEGDIICISSTIGAFDGGIAEVIINSGITLEIDPSEITNTIANSSNYFRVTAKNIPKEIEKVSFEWDYSDGSKKGLDDYIDVSNGRAMIKLMHVYKPSDKEEIYPLKVKLKDFYKSMVLAEAQAQVILSPNKPSLLVTPRHSTGPSGATFDMDAAVSPKGSYRFVWKIEGSNMSHIQTGEKSEFAPIIDKKGRYNVNVKLYSLDNLYLAIDEVTIYVDDDISLTAYQTHFDFKTQKQYNVEAHEVYPGLDVTFIVSEGKQRANSKYKYTWKINGVKENTAGEYGKWGNNFFLKVEEEARDWSAQIKGGVIGIGVTTVCVEVLDNKGRYIGKDCWTVTVKNPQGEYLDDNIMPDGDEDDY